MNEIEIFEKTKETLEIIKLLVIRLMKLKDKIYGLNRSYYGINRNIENMIHISREKLSESFLWLDKSYFQLKKNISEKKEYIELFLKYTYKK